MSKTKDRAHARPSIAWSRPVSADYCVHPDVLARRVRTADDRAHAGDSTVRAVLDWTHPGIPHEYPRLALLTAYMRERYAVRLRRLRGDPPERWTADPLLRTYKFTNVRRAWDRTTEWLVRTWYGPYAHDLDTVGRACAVARFVNYVPALATLRHPWRLTDVERTLTARAARGEQVFTGAYIISPAGGKTGDSKLRTVVGTYLAPVNKARILRRTWTSCAALAKELRGYTGWGAFMTQEVVQDAQFTDVARWATDRDTWAVCGPGALRGLRWVMGDAVTRRRDAAGTRGALRSITDDDATAHLNAIRNVLTRRWPVDHPLHVTTLLRTTLTAHDVEFCLCELDKYVRTLTGLGNPPRSKFTPTDPAQLSLL